jgi:hypothetical protein
MKSKSVVFCAVLALLLATVSAYAHHSFTAEFDASKPVTLTGTVTKVEWMNPHTWFYVDVKEEGGKVSNWGFELGSPNSLVRNGWSRNSLKVGDVVTVEASRSRNGSTIGNAKTVIMTNTGKRMFGASSQGQ